MGSTERLVSTQARLVQYYAAETAILTSQEYRIGNRSLSRADLAEVRQSIADLEAVEDELTSSVAGTGRRYAGRIVPRDL